MLPAERDLSIIRHIRDYCGDIREAVERFGNSYDAFASDKHYRNDCVLCILQIGELCNHLSDEFRNEYNEIPWRAIIGMRNVAAHHYGKMSTEQIWGTICEDIPQLQAFCENHC